MVKTPLPPPRTPEEAKKLAEDLIKELKMDRILNILLAVASIILAIAAILSAHIIIPK